MIGPWSPGALVGAYRLERELGRGGMGVVFGARETSTGAAVVIKTLTDLGPDEVARLEREGLTLARLKHPNLVIVHGAGWHQGRPYLVLQYASGGSLEDRLKQGALPWAEAVELGAQLAGALAAAHEVGVTHRDLKPANVLIDEAGRPLLADFGLARVSDLSRLTETGTVLGTPLYMAPEQAIGVDSGGAADVYSLGALLYAAISGSPPIPRQAAGIMAQLIALQEKTPPRLGTLAEVPGWLEDLIHEALARDPRARPSARALRGRLLEPPADPGPRGRVSGALALGGALAILAASLAWVGSQERAATPTPRAASPPPTPTQAASATPQATPLNKTSAPYPAAAAILGDLEAHLQAMKDRLLADPELPPDDLRYLSQLSELDLPQLAVYAHDHDIKNHRQRERRGAWAALELSLQGHLDWLQPACRGSRDIRASLPMITRLARSGHSGAQLLLRRIRIPNPREPGLAYQDAYHFLATATGLRRLASEGLLFSSIDVREDRRTEAPATVGAAWRRVYKYEALPILSETHANARLALVGRRPSQALPLYLQAWRERQQDSEMLAFELTVAADWEWSRHLREMGHRFTAGLPPPRLRISRETLRAEMRETLSQVTWGRGHYLLALTYLPQADPTRPHPRPPGELGPLIAATERALELDPGLSPARLLRAAVYRWEGDRASALTTIRLLASTSPHWRAPRLLFEALLLLEACEEEGGPIPSATRELYQEARKANLGVNLGWISGFLEVLYKELEERQ